MLIVTNFTVKIMSVLYRAVLIRIIGAEGLGLTELMSPFFNFLLVVASLGIPPVISNLISAEKDLKNINDIVKTGSVILLCCSCLVVLIAYIFFPFYANAIFSDDRIKPCFLALIPTIVLISGFSSLRGFFQGMQLVSRIGKSQVVEQSIRILCGVGLILFLQRNGYALAVVLIGFSVSSFFAESGGGLFLLRRYRKICGEAVGKFKRKKAFTMIRTGIPITVSRLILTMVPAIQAILIPEALIRHGASLPEATAFYGLFIGVAVSVLHLPSVITGALTTPLMPAIAAADANRLDEIRNQQIEYSLSFTYLITVPILILLYHYADTICEILFASKDAGPLLSLLALGGIFIYMQQPLTGILQGMNRFSRLLLHYFLTGILYLSALCFADYHTSFSPQILIFVFLFDDFILFIINYLYLKKISSFHVPFFKIYIAPLFISVFAYIVMIMTENEIMRISLKDLIILLPSACCFLFVYVILLFLFKVIDKKFILNLLFSRERRKNRQ